MPRVQLHFIERLAALLIAISSGLALIFGKTSFALGIAAGGAISLFNFFVLRQLMGALFTAKAPARQALLGLLMALKFALFGTLVFLMFHYLSLDALGVLVGVSLVVLSILIEGFRLALRGAAPQE